VLLRYPAECSFPEEYLIYRQTSTPQLHPRRFRHRLVPPSRANSLTIRELTLHCHKAKFAEDPEVCFVQSQQLSYPGHAISSRQFGVQYALPAKAVFPHSFVEEIY
jgi:hypothetical protein